MSVALKSLILNATTKHTATVIFLHGLGDTGHGWNLPVEGIFRCDSDLSHVKWILPHAPSVPVTANFGRVMPAWFDIKTFDFVSNEDERGMLSTVSSVNQLIAAEIDAGIDPGRIVVGGFSQGGAISLLTAFTNERKFAGVVCLSGWVVMRSKLKGMCTQHASSTPIFWGHGTADPLVTLDIGRTSVDFLKTTLGISAVTTERSDAPALKGVLFKDYAGLQHGAAPEELDDLKEWLKVILPKNSE
ncbi:Phospholipase/carboxylesterase [Russula ochroleuca]|jgi:predicted esterase|uniref:Acyl-protein thioesterase 1 n=1 Tax=Russula ochroleuca TaxID=152965 RepID=A0A9P5N2M6_9AGAM|nr:Phospholipase/carboxylesterase [Russula ochroleuca]